MCDVIISTIFKMKILQSSHDSVIILSYNQKIITLNL